MSKFTKGPWSVRKNWRDKLAVVGPLNDGTDCSTDRIANMPQRKNGEGAANAVLIASAPAMYETLKTIHHWLEAFESCPAGTVDAIRDKCKTALALAVP